MKPLQEVSVLNSNWLFVLITHVINHFIFCFIAKLGQPIRIYNEDSGLVEQATFLSWGPQQGYVTVLSGLDPEMVGTRLVRQPLSDIDFDSDASEDESDWEDWQVAMDPQPIRPLQDNILRNQQRRYIQDSVFVPTQNLSC